jgi:hypothetical protein
MMCEDGSGVGAGLFMSPGNAGLPGDEPDTSADSAAESSELIDALREELDAGGELPSA